ncbi:HD domain-containing protein [Galbibacter sp. BG1]|uniref:Pycsar system effector family protein n=1 Tax=Galbibacter sp. BG1 TaxID=1170699 RepID=UPI0015BDE037|nr:Pycsar system effector family protein [Galbibacter sp. BG1]QLE00704.1 HD domain-containing protein [Galbibacter sp. BG1]
MSDIIEKAKTYVSDLLNTKLDKNYLYHNLRHTQRVVKSATVLAENLNISQNEREILFLATWFHDTGYTVTGEDHEQESCKIATSFLKEHGYEAADIEKVCQTIMATKMGVEPTNLLEEIIKDADSSHLAKESFVNTSEMLRQELNERKVAHYDITEWRKLNIKLLSTQHRYYTSYAQNEWSFGKDSNLQSLLKKEEKVERRAKKEKLKVKLKSESPSRGVQTLYRTALRNHMKLSDIADAKANILLSVNAIIISLALANLIPKLDSLSNQHLIIPSLVLVVFSVISIIFAILSTKPNVSGGEFTQKDLESRKVNLLFFGNFYKMPLETYEDAMEEVLEDTDLIYGQLTKDLYYLGVVLARKYRLLRITYTVFMIGMISSVLTFIFAFTAL